METEVKQLSSKDTQLQQIVLELSCFGSFNVFKEASMKLFKPAFFEAENGEKMVAVKDCLTHEVQIISRKEYDTACENYQLRRSQFHKGKLKKISTV